MTFIDSRQQLHWAAQAVAGVGRSLLRQQPDDSHSTLAWSRVHRAMVGGSCDDGTHAGVRFRDLTLLVIKDRGLIDDEFPLRGGTIDDAFGFFEKYFGKMVRRPNDCEALGAHPPAMFDPAADDLARLDKLYDSADFVLQAYRSKRENAGEVRCWPHHFDIATLQTFDDGRSIGAGFLAGDEQFQQPYWYVNAHPRPADVDAFAPLPLGFWNKEHWFGAVLLGDQTREDAAAFLEAAATALSSRA